MRTLLLAAALGAMSLASGAAAGPDRQGGTTWMCIEPSGASRGPVCNRVLNAGDDDFCRCPANTTKVRAEVCGPGEAKPPESADLDRARRVAARDGSLIGDAYGDLRMCVKPSGPLPGRASR